MEEYETMKEVDTAKEDDTEKEKKKHKVLAVFSLILGTVSILCCSFMGLFIIGSVIGTVFGLIALIAGKDKNVRIMGLVGVILGIIGIVFNVMTLIMFVMMMNWDSFTLENLRAAQDIDPNNEQQIKDWIQQFFKIDISPYYQSGNDVYLG